jgi:hypothetical protein
MSSRSARGDTIMMSLFLRIIDTSFSSVLHPPSLNVDRLKEFTLMALTAKDGKLLSVKIRAVTSIRHYTYGEFTTMRGR